MKTLTYVLTITKCFSSDRLPQSDTSSEEEEVDDNTTPQAAGYQPLDTAANAGTSLVENDDNETPDPLAAFPRVMRQEFEEVRLHKKAMLKKTFLRL